MSVAAEDCEPPNDIISAIALTGHLDDSLVRRADVPANGGQRMG